MLVLLFGRTTTSFAHLTVADIQQDDSDTYLRLGDFTALLPPAAAAVFHALREATTSRETFHRTDPHTPFLFPGRFPGKPAPAMSWPASSATTASTPCPRGTPLEPPGLETSPARSRPTCSASTSPPPRNGPAAPDVTGPTTSPPEPKHRTGTTPHPTNNDRIPHHRNIATSPVAQQPRTRDFCLRPSVRDHRRNPLTSEYPACSGQGFPRCARCARWRGLEARGTGSPIARSLDLAASIC